MSICIQSRKLTPGHFMIAPLKASARNAIIHLIAIRYLMLVYTRQQADEIRSCDIRAHLKDQLTTPDFSRYLWQLFRALTSGVIGGIKKEFGRKTEIILMVFDEPVKEFFIQALHFDAFTIEIEFE